MCDMKCLECPYEDCVNDSVATEDERNFSADLDKDHKPKIVVDMTRYIHNRIDKEEYIKARNREYEQKRGYPPKRKEQKRQQYLRHREAKLEYQNTYYEEHKEEVLARQKAHYEAHKEEINAKRREQYRLRKEKERRERDILIKTSVS